MGRVLEMTTKCLGICWGAAAANPAAFILAAGIGLCAYVFSGSKRGNFSIGLNGISINYEK